MHFKWAYNALDEFWARLANAFDGVEYVNFVVFD